MVLLEINNEKSSREPEEEGKNKENKRKSPQEPEEEGLK